MNVLSKKRLSIVNKIQKSNLIESYFDGVVSTQEFELLSTSLEMDKEMATLFAQRIRGEAKLLRYFKTQGSLIAKVPGLNKEEWVKNAIHEGKRDQLIQTYLDESLETKDFSDLKEVIQSPSGAHRMIGLNTFKVKSLNQDSHSKRIKKISSILDKSSKKKQPVRTNLSSYFLAAAAIIPLCIGIYFFLGNKDQPLVTHKKSTDTIRYISGELVFNSLNEIDPATEYLLRPFSSIRTPRALLSVVKEARMTRNKKGWVLKSGAVNAQVTSEGEWMISTPGGTSAQVLGTRFTLSVYHEGLTESSSLEVSEGSVKYGNSATAEVLVAGERADIHRGTIKKYTLPSSIPSSFNVSRKVLREFNGNIPSPHNGYTIEKKYRLVGLPYIYDIAYNLQGGMWLYIANDTNSLLRINIESGYIDRYLELPEKIAKLSYINGGLLGVSLTNKDRVVVVDLLGMTSQSLPLGDLNRNITGYEYNENRYFVYGLSKYVSNESDHAFGYLEDSLKHEFPQFHDLKASYHVWRNNVVGSYRIGTSTSRFLALHDLESGKVISKTIPASNILSSRNCMAGPDSIWNCSGSGFLSKLTIKWK